MNKQQNLIIAAVSGLLALGSTGATAATGLEKCYGVAPAGKNDCASRVHGCAAQAQKDHDPADFKLVPNGTCQKIGGKLKPAPK